MTGPRRAKRLLQLEYGTYVLPPHGGKKFRVITMDPITHRQVERTATNEEEARRLARKLDGYRRAHIDGLSTSRTVSDVATAALEALEAGGRTTRYVGKIDEILSSRVLPLIGGVALEDWTPLLSRQVLDAARGDVGNERLQDIRRSLRVLVSHAQQARWISYSPDNDPLMGINAGRTTQVAPIDRRELPTIDQCLEVEAAIGEILGPVWKLAVAQTRETMVRWGELIALRPEDFTFVDDKGEALFELRLSEAICEAKGTFEVKDLKSHQKRSTAFAPWLVEPLMNLVSVSSPGERLFVRPDGRTPSRKWWSRKWRRSMDSAGFGAESWTLHSWRHMGACTWLFDRGADPGAASAALGHENVAFTLSRYTGARGSVASSLTRTALAC